MNHTQEQRQEQGQAQGQAQGQVQAQVQNLHLQNGHTQAHTIEDMLAQEVPVALIWPILRTVLAYLNASSPAQKKSTT
jgi:hypothetical protein